MQAQRPGIQRITRVLYSQWLLSALCCLPLVQLSYRALAGQLDVADPGRDIVFFLGEWALRLLLACLAIRPLSVLLGNPRIFPARRTLGLFCLGYASLHFLSWGTFLLGWRLDQLGEAVMESPYIIVGLVALSLLIPLGATSTRRAQIALGIKRWRYLHVLIYPAAILACIHLIWLSKDWIEPAFYAGILAFLFLWRFVIIIRRSTRT